MSGKEAAKYPTAPAAKYPTAKAALIAALAEAIGTREGQRLAEASFARFADLDAGWYWQLTFATEVTSDPKHAYNDDSAVRRITVIIDAWGIAVEKYGDAAG